MIEIDGSQGEGGGQILRTTLSLAACFGKSVHIKHIRQGRKKPGLMRQHLASVNAMKQICNAKVKGASMGSRAIEFVPGEIVAGDYQFSIGSAGSTTLVFQTVLPALMLADKPSVLTFEGGTHNPLAPSYDFMGACFLPQLKKMGLDYAIEIDRYGFYPVGAGKWSVKINPVSEYSKIKINSRGKLIGQFAKCIASGIPGHVIEREKKQLLQKLYWSGSDVLTESVDSLGSGNVVSLKLTYENVVEVVESIGAVGISAERVANKAIQELQQYQLTSAPVGHYLADQLMLPMVIANGGEYTTAALSEHSLTNIAVIKQLSGVNIKVDQIPGKKQWRISVVV